MRYVSSHASTRSVHHALLTSLGTPVTNSKCCLLTQGYMFSTHKTALFRVHRSSDGVLRYLRNSHSISMESPGANYSGHSCPHIGPFAHYTLTASAVTALRKKMEMRREEARLAKEWMEGGQNLTRRPSPIHCQVCPATGYKHVRCIMLDITHARFTLSPAASVLHMADTINEAHRLPRLCWSLSVCTGPGIAHHRLLLYPRPVCAIHDSLGSYSQARCTGEESIERALPALLASG